MKDSDMVAAQAEQDQVWMGMDDWYCDQDPELILSLVDVLDCEPSGGPDSIRSLDDIGVEVVRRLALHAIRELQLRRHSRVESEQ